MSDDLLPPETGSFDIVDDDSFDFREYGIEDYVTLVVFWLLSFDVFLQFFSRYVLGNSIAWTEEMARYMLVIVGFLGSTIAVRKGSHIAVEFFYRYMSETMGRVMSTLVDLSQIAFFLVASWITFKLADRTNSLMVSLDIPKSLLYYVVLAAFLLMLMRAIQTALRHWRTGTSELIFTEDEE